MLGDYLRRCYLLWLNFNEFWKKENMLCHILRLLNFFNISLIYYNREVI
jgi:hypothetical protein